MKQAYGHVWIPVWIPVHIFDILYLVPFFVTCRNDNNFNECLFDRKTTETIQMTGDKIVFNQTLLSLQKAITIKVPDTDVRYFIIEQ